MALSQGEKMVFAAAFVNAFLMAFRKNRDENSRDDERMVDKAMFAVLALREYAPRQMEEWAEDGMGDLIDDTRSMLEDD